MKWYLKINNWTLFKQPILVSLIKTPRTMAGALQRQLQARNKAFSRQKNKLSAFRKTQSLKSANKQLSQGSVCFNTQPVCNTVGKKQSTKKKQASQPVELLSDTSSESSDDKEQMKQSEHVLYDDDKELSDNESDDTEMKKTECFSRHRFQSTINSSISWTIKLLRYS